MADTFDVVFHGKSKAECTAFIRAVRQPAKDHGKIRDNQWIVDELYNAFDGEALTWYVCLPEDVQGDWARLQQALVTRWIKDVDDEAHSSVPPSAILPTTAAAAAPPEPVACPPNPAVSVAPPQTCWRGREGRVRIRANRIKEPRYLSKDVMTWGVWSGAFRATTDAALALKVRLIMAMPDNYRCELVNHESGLPVLAAFDYWTNETGRGSYHPGSLGLLIGVDAPGEGFLQDHRTTYNGSEIWKSSQFWTEGWQIEDIGRLSLRGPGDNAEAVRFKLGVNDGFEDVLWVCSTNARTESYQAEAVTRVNEEFSVPKNKVNKRLAKHKLKHTLCFATKSSLSTPDLEFEPLDS